MSNNENNNTETVADRIKLARTEHLHISQEALGNHAEVSKQAVSQWERGLTVPDGTSLWRIQEITGLSVDWVLNGSGEMLVSNTHQYTSPSKLRPIETFDTPEDLSAVDYVFVPQLSAKFSAGGGIVNHVDEIESRPPKAFLAEWIREVTTSPKHLMIFEVDGDSMSPRINHGDSLLVDTSRIEPENGKVYILRYGNEARVKRIHTNPIGGITLASDNSAPEYTDDVIGPTDMEHLQILGRVVWVGGTV